ncbi:MAG: fimbrillin family protein [Bacteroidaceae bacterium]
MKGKYFYLCAALFALNSCTNEINEDGFVDKSNTISFNSSTPKTRAGYENGDVANTTTLQTGAFGVVGYSNNALYLGATDKAAKQTYDGGNWKYANTDEIRYWPNNNMDFYAYFPFAATGDVFSNDNNSGNVMIITNNTGNQDVLFASAISQARVDRVDLQFHHAFSKIGGINIQIQNKDVAVEVKKVELINTSTKGQVLVGVNGKASYGTSTEHRAKDISPAVSITKTNTYDVKDAEGNPAPTYAKLVENADNGYVFATNGTETNYVTGTNTALWDGTNTWKGTSTLKTLGQVCLKLTCKVSTPRTTGTYYHVGGAGEDAYGVMYIPISGSKITDIGPNDADKTALLAGKRYIYNIIMKDNVGFDENGEAILLPILFKSTSVDSWDDVTVTITL